MDGMLTDVTVQAVGSAATQDQAIGDTSVTVEDPTDFAAVVDPADADGTNVGTLDIAGVQYDYTAVDPATGVITLATALTVAVNESDPVSVVVGGQVAQQWTALVDPGEGDNIPVPLDFSQRALFPEGHYDPPVPVRVADDLSGIEDVPNRQPVLSEQAVPPAVTDAINAAQTSANGKNVITYSEDQPGSAPNTAGDTWFVFTDDGDGNKLVTEQWHGDGGTDWTQVKVDNLLIANLDAGKITAGTLSAIDIDGVTIDGSTVTGGVVRTAASGARLEVVEDTSDPVWVAGTIFFYDSHDVRRGWIAMSESANSRNLYMLDAEGYGGVLALTDVDGSGNITSRKTILQSKDEISISAPVIKMPKLIQTGQATVTLSSAATGTVGLSFDTAFPAGSTVRLVATVQGTGGAAYYAYVYNVSTTAATVGVQRRDGNAVTGNIPVNWIAMVES